MEPDEAVMVVEVVVLAQRPGRGASSSGAGELRRKLESRARLGPETRPGSSNRPTRFETRARANARPRRAALGASRREDEASGQTDGARRIAAPSSKPAYIV